MRLGWMFLLLLIGLAFPALAQPVLTATTPDTLFVDVGSSANLQIDISYNEPGGSLVSLTNSTANTSLPASVTIPEGMTSAEVMVSGLVAGEDLITATLNGSQASSVVIVGEPGIDTDGDGLPDDLEDALGTNSGLPDTDSDGIDDFTETNGGIPIDTDGDAVIDALDPDSDGDGYLDIDETVVDSDGDSISDYRDLDSDDDGVLDQDELYFDSDADGKQNRVDNDDDGDGYLTIVEGDHTVNTDGDGDPDYLDGDSDNDAIPDYDELDADSDGDGKQNRVDDDDDGDGIPTDVEGTAFDDFDGDGIPNYLDQDSDDDGLEDYGEFGVFGTDWLDDDTDNDGLQDGQEANITGTDPRDADTDDDGLSDGEEIYYFSTEPLTFDTDNDQLSDGLELGRQDGINGGNSGTLGIPYNGTYLVGFQLDADTSTNTDPNDSDSDDDGLSDGDEDTNQNGRVDGGETDPLDADSDQDGLNDGDEVLNLGTNPLLPDTDSDGIDDNTETDGGLPVDTDGDGIIDALDDDSDGDGFLDSDPLEGLNDDDEDGIPNYRDPDSPIIDADGDNVSDEDELILGTDPALPDTDGDGIDDGIETDFGSPIDTDADGIIDALDDDSDGDGIGDITEGVADSDSDGIADFRDPDDDGDGILTVDEGTGDGDGDGIPNYLDLDSDDDGFSDEEETAVGSNPYDPASTPVNVHDPALTGISDVGNDQGRRVRVSWLPSNLDVAGSPEPIVSYSIYRRIDGNKSLDSANFVRHEKAEGSWDFVLNLPASGEVIYNSLAETLCDSTESGVCWSAFFVRAHTAAPTAFYDSPPDSGYSVDNLAPGAPGGFAVTYGPENLLSWEPSEDEDFRYFKVYRGTEPGFTPSADNLLASTAETAWADLNGTRDDHYLVSAVDFAGNEGPASAPGTVSNVGQIPAARNALFQNAPNPFNPKTTIGFSLAEADRVSLTIHDVSGRLVRTLVAGQTMTAGPHEEVWDGKDRSGRTVAAGVYFYSVRSGSFSETRRMLLVK